MSPLSTLSGCREGPVSVSPPKWYRGGVSKDDKLVGRIDELEAEYRPLLLKALRECAAGRWGLFGHNEHLGPKSEPPPTIGELTDLAQVIDAL
jgi:hypothetical protein